MRAWKCKCGKVEWFGSDAPAKCNGCEECGHNAYGEEAAEHTPTTEETIRDGVTIRKRTYCRVCHEQLEKHV